jgi:hypothetical protein
MDLTEEAKAPNSPLAAHAAVQAKLDAGAAGAARALLEASTARWPGNPKLLLLKGELLERQAQPREAALHYAALTTDPAIAVWASGRLAALLKGDPLPLADAAAVVRDVSRSDVDAKLKGSLLNALLSHDDGEGTLLDIAGTLSSLFQYELRLAVRRTERKDFAGALSILEAARDAGRVSVRSAVLMAELLRLEGRLPDAIGVLEDLLPQHRDQPELLRQLTMMLQRAGDYAREAEIFAQAARRWPQDWMLLHRLNRLPLAPQRLREIFAIFDAGAGEALDRNDRYRFQFALAALQVGEVARGIALLERRYEEPTSILAVPVRKALRARPAAGWREGSRFSDDRTKDVQIATSPGARASVVLTTGISFGFLPLAFVDTLFAAHGLNVIYLRDFRERAYLRGIVSLGADEAETIAALKRLVAELGTKRTIVMGSSAGGFSALRYGALMGADIAVSFSGPTAGVSYFDTAKVSAWNPDFFVKALLEREGDLPFDLVPLLSKTWPTKFIQFYGRDSPNDARQAKRLEGLPNVTLMAVPDVGDHFVVDHMIADGSFEALLGTLASG